MYICMMCTNRFTLYIYFQSYVINKNIILIIIKTYINFLNIKKCFIIIQKHTLHLYIFYYNYILHYLQYIHFTLYFQ